MTAAPELHVQEFLNQFAQIRRLGLRWVIVKNLDGSREIYYQSRFGPILHLAYSKDMPFASPESTNIKTFVDLKHYVYTLYTEAEIMDSDGGSNKKER